MTDFRAQIDNAAARRAADTAQLSRADGSRRFSEDEHIERKRTIDSRFREEVDTLRASIATEISASEEQYRHPEASSALDALSPDELSEAGFRAQFAREEVEGLGAEDLRARVAAVTASGYKPRQATFHHYLRRRVAGEPTLGIVLQGEIAALEERLGRAPALREARANLEALRETHEYGGLKLSGFNSVLERHMNQTYEPPGAAAPAARR